MGEWSEAINAGLICKRCFMPLVQEGDDEPLLPGPTLCTDCASKESEEDAGKFGPNWRPPR